MTKAFGKMGYITVDLDNIWTRNRKYQLHDDSGWIQLRFTDSHYLIIEEWRLGKKTLEEK